MQSFLYFLYLISSRKLSKIGNKTERIRCGGKRGGTCRFPTCTGWWYSLRWLTSEKNAVGVGRAGLGNGSTGGPAAGAGWRLGGLNQND